MQYTIRGVSSAIDEAIRTRAKATGKSLNETALDALADGVGLNGTPRKRRDLSDIVGTWVSEPEVEQVLEEQRNKIDEDMWR